MFGNCQVAIFKQTFEKDNCHKIFLLSLPLLKKITQQIVGKTLNLRFHLFIIGVEDLEGYHGKALGEKGKAAVELIKKSIVNDSLSLRPQPVTDDVPAVDLTVKLSDPPNYKIGDKVGRLAISLNKVKPVLKLTLGQGCS